MAPVLEQLRIYVAIELLYTVYSYNTIELQYVYCTLANLDCSNKPYLDTIVKSIFFSPSKIWHGMGIRRNKHTNCSANFLYMFFFAS